MIEEIQKVLNDVGLADWLNDWDIKNVYEEVSKLESGIYLEIGVAHGASLAVASLAAKPGIKVYGIDVINWQDRDEKIKKFLDHFGREPIHEFIEGESQLLARYWKNGEVDVLFIDGDHTYEGVVKDLASWLVWLKSGGVAMFDDYNDITGVRKAIQEILFEHKQFYDHTIYEQSYLCRKL